MSRRRAPGPLVAVDVHYDDDLDLACAAALWFPSWEAERPIDQRLHFVEGLEPYVPGRFFERELPCLLPLLEPLVDQVAGDLSVLRLSQ